MSLAASLTVSRPSFALELELDVAAGETAVLVGPNGSGKSTLVEALAGLVPLERGRVTLAGRVLEDSASGVRLPPRERNIGVAFQGLHLFGHLSVRDNVAFGLIARGQRWREAREAVAPWLERFGLTSLARRRARELSGGEAQRVALARALAPRPTLLLLDEPLSALDVERRPQLRGLLREVLAEQSSVRLVITHDAEEALALADRLWVLEEGRIVASGTTRELARAPATPYVSSLLGLRTTSRGL
jgi:molybdate transport system ATP-binding protein